MNDIFKENTLNAIVFKIQLIYSSDNLEVAFAQLFNDVQVCNFDLWKIGENILKRKPENSYCSSMQRVTGLQFYYVIADPKVC